MYPFAIDPGGNYLCFDYAESTKNPSVVLWNHEGFLISGIETHTVEFIADSFESFLEKLYKPEDDNEDIDFSEFKVWY